MGKRRKKQNLHGEQWKQKLTRIKEKGGERLRKGKEALGTDEEATVILPPVTEKIAEVPQPAADPGEPGTSDNSGGKRVRKEPVPRKKWSRKVLYSVAGLVVVLLAGYLVLCGTVCQGVMLPNTYVNGHDISGMTQEEATQAVKEIFAQDYASVTLTVAAEGENYTVDLTKALDLNADSLVQEAYDHGHSGFLSRGMAWILSHLKSNARNVLPHVSDEAALEESVAASGVLKVDTAVADSYKLSEQEITFTIGTSGQKADQEQLKEELQKAAEEGNYDQVIQCPMTKSKPKALDLDQVYKEVYAEPVNATLDPEKDYAVVDAVQGVSFDKKEAQAAIADLKEGESASVKLKRTDPEITTENLKSNLFKDQLGTYSTNVTGTAARLSNVRLAAQHCNGTILLADEVFSYNDVVGQRTAARGFQKAGAYLNGITVQELGGGVCQVSSTLYSATVLANLEIVQRQNHTYESTYIPLGMDATVSWGGPDYQFKNNTKYPIKVVTSYSGGVLTCQIWGTKTDDITVKFTHEVLATINYGTVKKEDSTMAAGTSMVSVTGETGYKVQSYRELYDANGKLISKNKEAYSVYSKRDQVVVVGTKVAEKKQEKPAEEKKQEETKPANGDQESGNQDNNSGGDNANGDNAGGGNDDAA